MSILIKGMEMPFTCLTCDFHKCAGGVGDFCSLTKRRQFRFKNRPKDCPLIELPPHGRLIDAEALLSLLDKCMFPSDMVTTTAVRTATNWIKEAPTIIEAEGEE